MPKKPSRNLEEEFTTLHPLYKASPMEHVEQFGELYITTLQAEKKQQLWSELSRKFPLTVRLYSMQHMRASFMRRLKLGADTVNRWTAEQELRKHESRLNRAVSDEDKEKQATLVAQCLAECGKLMIKLIKSSAPGTMGELRELLDSAYDYELQLRVMEGGRAEFMKAVPAVLPTKERFHFFKETVRAGKLYNTTLVDQSSRPAYYAHIEPLAMQLHADIVSAPGNLDAVLSKYPIFVQHYALGDRQCVLVRKLEGRIPIREIRAAVAAIKDELNPDTEADTMIALLVNLRRNLKRSKPPQSSFRQWVRELLSKEVQTLPVKILLVAIRNADPAVVKPQELKAALLRLLYKMPSTAACRPIARYGEDVACAAPAGFEKDVNQAMTDYLHGL
jgi:hypothetical protein